MRLLACAVMLVLIPAASAQMPTGSLDIEADLELAEADPGDVFNATIEVLFHCPTVAFDFQGDSVVELNVAAAPGLSITGPQSRTIQALSCMDGEEHVVVFPLQVFVAEDAYGVREMDFHASMYTSNQQLSPAPHDVETRQAIKVHGEPPVDEASAALVPQDDSLAEEAPGPAIPLLAAGLLALARRRQA